MVAHVVADGRVDLRLHGGGLIDQPQRLPEAKRRQIRQADGRIAALTGQVFGPAYLDHLLDDPATIWHSQPTIAAMLAARAIDPGKELRMMQAVQTAHYADGLRVVEPPVLIALAGQLGLPEAAFEAAHRTAPVAAHIDATRALMDRMQARGYPTFLLQVAGRLVRVDHEFAYGNPEGFLDMILQETVR